MRKRIPRRILTAALSLAMLLALLPATALADGDTGETTTSGIELSKTATLEDDGTYTIDLEAYATGTVTSTAEKQPMDIILVLDQSGSMAYDFNGKQTSTNSDRRQYAMKNAVNTFIKAVYEDSTELDGKDGDVEHKVGIVTFGSSSTTLCSLQSVESGYSTLTSAVSGLPNSPSGATNTSAGMETANNMIDTTSTDRQTIVILFTDGVPTTGSSFSTTVANGAISAAKSMKDKGAIVYTVGIFSGVDTTYIGAVGDTLSNITTSNSTGETQAANRFMNLVSSNTTTATDMGISQNSTSGGGQGGQSGNSYTITTNYDYSSNGYYKSATSATELTNVFSEIQKESAGTTVTLDSESVLKDIMGDGFELSVSDASCVTVQTADYKGDGEFDTPVTFSDAVVTVEDNTVFVSGFDYKSNYVVDASSGASGKKLIVTITGVLPTENVTTGEEVSTNNADSGIYATADATEATATFEQPQTIITKKLYVLDYAKTATLSDLDQNSVTGIVDTYKKVSSTDNALTQAYGTSALSGSTLSYTPTTTSWDGYDSLYVFGQTNNSEITALDANKDGYLWSKVSVIPANNVYYEDDFITTQETDEDGNVTTAGTVGIVYTGDWSKVGTTSDNTETANGSTYGWETTLSNDTGDSDGSSHSSSTDGATATFTFTGTGVDIYSRTDLTTGTVYAKLTGTTDSGTSVTKRLIVDDLAVSAADENGNGTYYQIPTVSFEVEYGTYTVTLTVTSQADNGERCTYYLDGIRVYNPLGTVTDDGSDVGMAYKANNELNAVFTEVRNILIEDVSGFSADSAVTGAVFIDELDGKTGVTTDDLTDYTTNGPKNEVYLSAGQAIVFQVDTTSDNTYYLGLKSADGFGTTATVTNGDDTSPLNINHSTDLYYEITPSSDGYIMVENTGTNLLSITKLRTTNPTDENSGIATDTVVGDLITYANSFSLLSSVSYMEDAVTEDELEDGTTVDTETGDVVEELDEEDIEIDNPTEDTKEEPEETETPNSLQSIFSSLFSSIRNWFSGRR